MPANGGTTCRFMRPRALQPPTVQLGNAKQSGVIKFSLIEVEALTGDTAQALIAA